MGKLTADSDFRALVDHESTIHPHILPHEDNGEEVSDHLMRKLAPVINGPFPPHPRFTFCDVPSGLRWQDCTRSRTSYLIHPSTANKVTVQATGVITEINHVAEMAPESIAPTQLHRAGTTMELLTGTQWTGYHDFLRTYEHSFHETLLPAPEICAAPTLTKDPMIYDARGVILQPSESHDLHIGDIVLEDFHVHRVGDMEQGLSAVSDDARFWRICWELLSVVILYRA